MQSFLGGNEMLRIENLTKSYGDKVAVDNLSLHIMPGEIYGFIGHNGAGKTTTLKACCGILNFDKGEIFIDGLSIKADPYGCKKRIAYIPDNPDLYEFLTGIQYLNFIADIFGISAHERKEKINEYSELFDLKANLAQHISSYSHGMKQIIMDEPFVGLDPIATHKLKQLMRKICDEGGAIFFSTHILEVAEKLCDKVAIIKEGKLVISGTMSEVMGNTSLEDVFLELEEKDA
jgi:ABC-2 type transport system ATP-binding protein